MCALTCSNRAVCRDPVQTCALRLVGSGTAPVRDEGNRRATFTAGNIEKRGDGADRNNHKTRPVKLFLMSDISQVNDSC